MSGPIGADVLDSEYVCVARPCKHSPNISVSKADLVWVRERPNGMQMSRHRDCVDQLPACVVVEDPSKA